MSIPLVNFEACQAQSIGTVPATSLGTAFTTSGSTNTKSAYTQLTAATASDIGWLIITFKQTNQTTSFKAMAIDIAIGAAGSEIDIIPNLVFSWANIQAGWQQFAIPISIPEGSRIAFRWQASAVGDTLELSLMGFTANFQVVSSYDAMGFVAANSCGTLLTDAASSNTKSAYTQIISATSRDYVGFFYVYDTAGQNDTSAWLFDIAFGAAASEVIVIPDISVRLGPPSAGSGYGFVPMQIPAGTRLSSRLQTSNFTNTFERPDLTIYGAVG